MLPCKSLANPLRSLGFRRQLRLETLELRQLLAGNLLFSDSFEVGEWNGHWAEDSQNDWYRSAQRATDGSQSAEVDGSASNATLTLADPIDLSGYSSAELTFSWYIESSWDTNEYIALDVYASGTWTEVDRLRGNIDAENTWHHETINLNGYLNAGFQIRFRASVSDGAEDGNIDNVKIVGTLAGPPQISISDATLSEIGGVTTFIASGSGGLNSPRDIIMGPDGNIYVGSQGTHSVIRYHGTTGALLGTFVTSGSGGLANPDGLTFGMDGNLYVASANTNSILKYNGSTGAFLGTFVPSGSGGLDRPSGIEFGSDGNLYVSSFFTRSILRYNGNNGAFLDAFVAPGTGGLSRPLDLTFGPDGDLYVGIWDLESPSAVSRFDGDTGDFVSNFVPRDLGGIRNPRGLAFDQDGRLYVADFDTNSIHRYDSEGQYLDDLVGSTGSPLRIPMGIAFDTQGALLISSNDRSTDSVFRYDRGVVVSMSTASATPVTVDYQTFDDSAVAPVHYTAQTGTIAFDAGQTTRRVLLASKDDSLVNTNRIFTVQLNNPMGGAVLSSSVANVTLMDDDAGRQINVSDTSASEGDYQAHYRGKFIEVTPGVNLGNSGMFHGGYYYASPGPSSMAPIDRYDAITGAFVDHFIPARFQLQGVRTPTMHGGYLYVGSEYTDEVHRYDGVTGEPAGISGLPGDAVFVAAGSGGLDGPHSLSFGPDGNLYVTGRNSFNVVRYHGVTGQPLGSFNTTSAGALQWPQGLTIDSAGIAYVASPGTNQIQKYSTVTGAYLGAITNGALAGPGEVQFGPDGLLYVLSTGNSRILRFTAAGNFIDDYVPPGSGGMNYLARMAFGPDGDLYVSGFFSNNFIYRFGTQNEAVINISLSTPSSVPVTVDYATADLVPATALAGSDYAATTGSVTFAAGSTVATVRVPLIDDSEAESVEAFSLSLSNAVGGLIVDGTGLGTIADDDHTTKFYVVDDASPDRTFEYGASGATVENYSLGSGNTAPRGAASNMAGDKVWVVDANKKVYVYNDSGVALGSWTAGSLTILSPQVEGIATNGTDVWIVDARQDRVYRYANAASRLSGSQNAIGSFPLHVANTNPKDIVTDGTSLWGVNESSIDQVFKYTLSGLFEGSWTITAGGGSPTGITLDPSGASQSLWIVDNTSDRVYEYAFARSLSSGSQAAAASFALAADNANPQGIADPPAPNSPVIYNRSNGQGNSERLLADVRSASAVVAGQPAIDLIHTSNKLDRLTSVVQPVSEQLPTVVLATNRQTNSNGQLTQPARVRTAVDTDKTADTNADSVFADAAFESLDESFDAALLGLLAQNR